MLRLAHRVLSCGGELQECDGVAEMRDAIGKSPCIIADDVAMLFDHERAFQSQVDPLMLPFESVFVEWNNPRFVGRDAVDDEAFGSRTWWSGTERLSGRLLEVVNVENWDGMFEGGRIPRLSVYSVAVSWHCNNAAKRSRVELGEVINYSWFPDGEWAITLFDQRYFQCERPKAIVSKVVSNDVAMMVTQDAVAFMAIALMHCRNVIQEDVTKERGPSQAWLKRQRLPEIKYKLLNVRPLKSVLKADGVSQDDERQLAMHICRGHCATYTNERPLFGKYSGRFWIPAHVKGDPSSGIVDKDYRVQSPSQPS